MNALSRNERTPSPDRRSASPWLAWRPPGSLTLFAATFLILVLRRPEAILEPRFWAEDRTVFYRGALAPGGIESLLSPYAGYLLLVPRLIALPTAFIPETIAPLALNLAALAVTAGVATYLASARLQSVLPDPRHRALVALVFVLLPGYGEVLGTVTNLQWVLAIWLIAVALTAPPPSHAGRTAELTALALAGLTGPFAILLLPLYVWQRRPDRIIVLALCAIAQGVTLLNAGRDASGEDVAFIPLVLTARLFLQPLLGTQVTIGLFDISPLLPSILGVVVGTVILASAPWIPRATAVYLVVVIPLVGATLASFEAPYSELLSPPNSPRYFFVPGALLALLMLAGSERRPKPVTVLLAVLLAIGVATEFRVTLTSGEVGARPTSSAPDLLENRAAMRARQSREGTGTEGCQRSTSRWTCYSRSPRAIAARAGATAG